MGRPIKPFKSHGTGVVDLTASAPASVTLLPASPIRINAGGAEYTDTLGQVWSADTDFSGGDTFSTSSAINGTEADTLYQSVRYGDFQYQFATLNGDYKVNLRFAETFLSNAGERVFDVAINGQTVLANFDVVAEAEGTLTAVDRLFPVSVTTGQITIAFTAVVANPAINAIEITPDSGIAVSMTPTRPAGCLAGSAVQSDGDGSHEHGCNLVAQSGSGHY